MAREADTYRAARRNACRELTAVWGPNWYFARHDHAAMVSAGKYRRATILKRAPSRYHPIASIRDAFPKVAKATASFIARTALRMKGGRGQ